MFHESGDDHLVLLEHPHVFTHGAGADLTNVLVDPASVGATLVKADRGGDVTYHGPGQLVGYPIRFVSGKRGGGLTDNVAYVRDVEELLIDALGKLGLDDVGRLADFPGVWVEPESDNPRKIAAIGVRLSRGRTMHGFALNVDPDMAYFGYIVPCGIEGKAVTSLAREGVDASMHDVVDVIASLAAQRWAPQGREERADIVWRQSAADLSPFSRGEGPGKPGIGETSVRIQARLDEAGVTDGLSIRTRKPEWLRVKAEMGPAYLSLKQKMRSLDLVTVCEEAGCPNIYECWSEGTATFMINGERCTRKCGFCLVDTRRPEEPDPEEPARVAEAVDQLGLDYAVITTVARDDLDDHGATGFVDTIAAIRKVRPHARVEVLISDCRGDEAALDAIFAARPDVLNHNLETVIRLQRAVRPSAGYARSLAVLARAKAAGLVTKSSIMVGLGESVEELRAAMADLAAVGTDIVTIGQYLRPTSNHIPVDRFWEPAEFEELKRFGEDDLGIAHVESSPLTRSSFHAKSAESAARSSMA